MLVRYYRRKSVRKSVKSLLWFAEALALNAGPPERAAVDRLRIAAIVAQGPRLATVIIHDGQPVAAAAFHPSKDQLATVGRDRRLRVWDIPTGETVLLTEAFPGRPSDVFFSPGGEVILVASSEFNQVRLLSASDGKSRIEAIPHFAGGANNRPLPPHFDPSGERLLTQSAPQTLRVWDARAGAPLGPPIPLGAPIAWMDFSEAGVQVLVITEDGKATVWDWRTGGEVTTSPMEGRVPRDPNLSDPSEGEVTQRPDLSSDFGPRISDLPPGSRPSTVFSPDGSRYATLAADHRVRVWDSETNEPLIPPIDHNPASGPVGFSANGRFFFTMHPAHAVYVWVLLPPDAEPPVLLRPEAPVTKTGDEVMPGDLEGRAPRVPLLPSEFGSRISDLNLGSRSARPSTVSSPDGTVIVTRDPGSPIRVRTLSGAGEVSLHPSSLKEVPVQAWFDDTGKFIILEYPNQRAQIWDAATGLPVTPGFRSRYATDEAGYSTIRFPSPISHLPFPISDDESPDAPLPTRHPPPQALAELLSGSRLDGTGGWQALELGGIVGLREGLEDGGWFVRKPIIGSKSHANAND